MGVEFFGIGASWIAIMAIASLVFGTATVIALIKRNTIAIPFFSVSVIAGGIAYAFAFHSNENFQEGLRILASQMPQ